MSTEIRATVFTIDKVYPHPDADKLEIVHALGWQVVCGKGLRHPGQKCVYIQPESLVPDEWANKWEVKPYLKGPLNNRVGQVRLRGQPSFGFIVEDDQNWQDGDNVASYYGITKYEPPIRTSCGDAERDHTLFRKYTDVENMRNFPDLFQQGEEVVATEKAHGTNSRCGKIDGELMAGSMELRRKKPADEEDYKKNTYWFPLSIPNVRKMIDYLSLTSNQVIVYGEVYGPSIQPGYAYDVLQGHIGFKVFDILVDSNFLNHDEVLSACIPFGVEMVPELYRGPFSIDAIKKVADGPSQIGCGSPFREGVVVRPVIERFHPVIGRLILKYVGSEYLLSKHSDSKDR
jgi:RNA ligase (TIGR02306 family)